MDLSLFKSLLNQVNNINTKYEKINELTGDNFNVFRILKVESSEVRTHSAFLAELLNPKGSHGQKDIFLKLFTELFCFKGNKIDTASCQVKVEDYIGVVDITNKTGGRIDITITDRNANKILIENKIYAGDQKDQILRYYNYHNTADLIYLTLDGKSPITNETDELKDDVHYKCFSYQVDIINWLEQCRKEVAVYPIVREAITHYINLIKYLTGQTINATMENELSALIASNIDEAFLIANNLNKACDQISRDFGNKIINHFAELDLICEYTVKLETRHTGIFIRKPEWQNVKIGFVFENYDKSMIYGFNSNKNDGKPIAPMTLRESIKNLNRNGSKNSEWWLWYRPVDDPFNNWENLEAWKAIKDGRMKDMLIEKTQYLIDLTQGLEL